MTDTKFARTRDPDSIKPYLWDWSTYLGDDTLADAEFITYDDSDAAVAVDASAFDSTTATAWISGGLAGTKALVTCRVTTTAGIVDDRTLYLNIKEM